jgi:hypothetical protein
MFELKMPDGDVRGVRDADEAAKFIEARLRDGMAVPTAVREAYAWGGYKVLPGGRVLVDCERPEPSPPSAPPAAVKTPANPRPLGGLKFCCVHDGENPNVCDILQAAGAEKAVRLESADYLPPTDANMKAVLTLPRNYDAMVVDTRRHPSACPLHAAAAFQCKGRPVFVWGPLTDENVFRGILTAWEPWTDPTALVKLIVH